MVGRCRLCLEERELQRSHIIPDFVGRWLKDSSATGFLRYSGSPNRRYQDTERLHLLCDACEQRLSVWERTFQREIFTKLTDGSWQPPYPYGPWLLLLGVSLCWRAVLFALESGHDLTVLTAEQRAMIREAMERWRAFMLGDEENPSIHRVHFLPLGVLSGFTGVEPPGGMNTYLVRTVQTDVLGGGDRHGAWAFSKIGPAAFVGFISPPPRLQWKGTALHVRRGLVPKDGGMPLVLFRYFEEQARNMVKAVREDLSPRQQERIAEAYRHNPERVAQSDTTRVMRADVEMFGDGFLLPPSESRDGSP
jgi:hypothetical protein